MDCSSQSYDPSCSVSQKVVGNAKDHKIKVGGNKKSGKGVKLSTDAQSIAARERRHRISERFKILQSLVPGGSKMDTVSMLEEAIQYVKFLKTQIWLHQSMIFNYADSDPNLLLIPNNYYLSPNQCSTDHLYAQKPNMAAEAGDALLPQMGFPHSANYSSYDEEIMAMPFDALLASISVSPLPDYV